MEQLTDYVFAILLVTLRLGPALAFAPPFTLLKVPVFIRVLLAIGLSIWLVAALPQAMVHAVKQDHLLGMVVSELIVGIAIALGLQLTFASIYWVGRAIDIQAGFGLAMLADPTTNAQIPLVGTILAYGAAMIFFAIDGHYDLLALWAASFETIPLGYVALAPDSVVVAQFMSSLFLIAIGLVGISMLSIFLTDLVIAFLSRTLPQMNVLLLGFQAKALVMLVTLPVCIAFSYGIFLRLLRMAVTSPAGFTVSPS